RGGAPSPASASRGVHTRSAERRPRWTSLALGGPRWTSVDLGGPRWPSVALADPRWTSVDLAGPRWPSLTLAGPRWPSLDLGGPRWPSLTRGAMSRSLDAARSFLERLEARGGREGPVLAGEFSVARDSDLAPLLSPPLPGPLMMLYQDIQARSAAWKADGMFSTKAGSRPENMRKNRYKDVLPYDQTRVILSLLQEEGHSDYINGNFIRGVDGSLAYIATQGPLPHTLLDFWRLVWEFGVKVILMACREIENGRVGVLCPQVSCPHARRREEGSCWLLLDPRTRG
ncbi:uncharacterized protein LOC111534798, partial [Piliocolobus tephrosceles]|uniref:uncharacterized protein LOC111534798 n=1 Tax=Piliocolobus tephrosceles TaxID=591936 RepID=UPI0013010969